MAMSNAERQKLFRQRRKAKADSLSLRPDWAWPDPDEQPQEYARLTWALMLELIQHGSADTDIGFDDDALSLRVRADMGDLPQDVEVALRFGMRAWLSETTRALWKRDGNIDFEISIIARTDKRKWRAMESKLAKEKEDKEDEA